MQTFSLKFINFTNYNISDETLNNPKLEKNTKKNYAAYELNPFWSVLQQGETTQQTELTVYRHIVNERERIIYIKENLESGNY